MDLTSSQTHYIKTVYELSSTGDSGARIVDIADRLGFSKASVSLAMTRLEKDELVYKDEHRHIHLTPAGERHAVMMMDKYALIEEYLIEVLGLDPKIAEEDACAMEHVISVETLCGFCRQVRERNTDTECPSLCRVPKWVADAPANP